MTLTALESYGPTTGWWTSAGFDRWRHRPRKWRPSWPEDDRGTVVYVQLPDLEASLERAKGLDATVDMGVTLIPSSRTRFAILRDPLGTRVGLFAE